MFQGEGQVRRLKVGCLRVSREPSWLEQEWGESGRDEYREGPFERDLTNHSKDLGFYSEWDGK